MTATPPEFTGTTFGDTLAEPVADAEGIHAPHGIGPYALAWRRLRRNKVALAFGGLFLLMVVLCLLAPVYAQARRAHRARRQPHHRPDHDRRQARADVVSLDGIPIGPTYHGRFFLGADSNGRDVAVRLLYGGRNSLEIGFLATLITMLLATITGICRRLPPRRDRRDPQPHPRPHLVVPGRPARRRPGHGAGARRDQPRALHDPGQLAVRPGGDHRRRLRPVRRQAAARPGARPAREGVRRRGARPGPGLTADHVHRDPAQRRLDDHRLRPADHRQRDPARGRPVVPRRRRPAAERRRGGR